MATRTIEVVVAPDGTVTVEAIGYTGRECEVATRAVEAALGRPVARRWKPEAQQRAGQRATVKGGQR